MKNGSCSATTVAGSAALPFVISTGGVMGLRPTQGDEKRVLFSNYCCWKRRPPLCHLDRISHGRWPAQGDETRFSSNYCRWKRRPPLCHLDRISHGRWPAQGDEKRFPALLSLEAPPSPLSSRPERSAVERSAVSAVLPW